VGVIKVVQIYDIGDVDKTKLMIEQINQILDELKYTETRIVAMQLSKLCQPSRSSRKCRKLYLFLQLQKD
jgi:hypothetical protein